MASMRKHGEPIPAITEVQEVEVAVEVARLPVISGDDFVKAMHKIGYVWDHNEGSTL